MIYRFLTRQLIKICVFTRGKKIWKNFLFAANLSTKEINHKTASIINHQFQQIFKSQAKDQKLVLQNISKTYSNGFKAVDNFSLTIEPQDFVCLLGPSGCGKTTILRMMAGLEVITSGKYLMNQRELNTLHPAMRKTAMVFQNYALYPFMSVYENIAFGLKLKTYRNDIFEFSLDKLITRKKINNQLIKDYQYEIKLLRHPHQNEINQLAFKLKQVKIKNDQKLVNDYQKQLNNLKKIANQKQVTNKTLIIELQQKIKVLKEEQRIAYQKTKNQEIDEQAKQKQKIKQLKNEEKDYYLTKKAEIPHIKIQIKQNIKTRKAEIKNQTNQLKQILKNSKEKNDKAKNLKYDKLLQKFNQDLVILDEQINNLTQQLKIIKHKNIWTISQITSSKTSWKDEIKQLIKMAVVWRYSIPYRIYQLAKTVGLEQFLKRKPAALSGGQRQRVALIRAISKDAQLFLFDEPLSNLDAKLRSSMRQEIKKIHDLTNSTSLYVTHDQIEAMTMANKVVVMNLGYIQQVGKPKDLYENPANIFVARFIGSPTINLLKVKYANNQITLANNKKLQLNFAKNKNTLVNKLNNQEVILGIRAEDIKLSLDQKQEGINGIVESLELTGSNYIVNVKIIKQGMIKVLIPSNIMLQKGTKVKLEFKITKAHLFNPENGLALSSVLNQETRAAQTIWNQGKTERISNQILLTKESQQKTSLIGAGIKKISQKISLQKQKEQVVNKIAQKNQKINDYNLATIDEEELINS